jgi:hypothetical protein
MLDLDARTPAPIWLIWPYLSWLERLSFLAMCILAVYSLLLAVKVVRFRKTARVQENLVRIRKRIRNLQQATVAAFYFFGFVLFAGFQFAYFTIEHSSIPVGLLVVRNFQIHFAFAGNVFLILLIFHFVQWFIANRVGTLDLQSNS